ncbi:hypothetical protein [Microbacterium sulfonylureivorans]|uniref:hypothetical protein n=1 Tax=Microbacterium sulfonylureivorans TaxID=2486854 RepID=UPI000FDC576F|nr:hypothetical protein [Microbacterium sulfonylureivorans]
MDLYDPAAVREHLVRMIAEVEGVDADEVYEAIAAAGEDGDFQLRSKIAESVIAGLEEVFGVTLPAPADLPREEFATVNALLELIVRELNQASGAA